ncbi:hypothetical protein [Dyadobacter fermentans]|uniref:hypothetical protein n=1 Tax=Dyadobacter fermentans TaxID=94254 RepID=UPI001CBC28A9|nr:hypothetical protein [Dyadobacter fermentans]MBZ1359099.1 hypothetical protein [Dyadobacter fermentans]
MVATSTIAFSKSRQGCNSKAKANALSSHAQGHCPDVLSHWFATDITCLTALIVGALLSSCQETAINRVSDETLVEAECHGDRQIPSGMQQQGQSNALSLHAQGHCPDVLSHWFATDITCLTALIVGALLSSWQQTAKSR